MSIIAKLTLRHLLENRKRTVVTILGIATATALISAILLGVFSFFNTVFNCIRIISFVVIQFFEFFNIFANGFWRYLYSEFFLKSFCYFSTCHFFNFSGPNIR